MKPFSNFTRGILFMSALASTSVPAATFVYVSNAEDGEIGAYSMQADGALKPLARTQAGEEGIAMAGSPKRGPLYAASPAQTATVPVYSIKPRSRAPYPPSHPPPAQNLTHISVGPD